MRKFIPLLFFPVLTFVAQGANFTNGQAARAVIGQNGFTDAYAVPLPDANSVQLALPNILGGASGLAYNPRNGMLYVADSNRMGAVPQNNRIIGFSTTQIPLPEADLSTIPTHPSADCWLCGFTSSMLVGQQDYTTTLSGLNSLPTSSGGSLNIPTAVATDGQTFAIADTDNNRVLIWSTPPASQATPPNVVLGQTSFTARPQQATTSTSLRGPQGVWIQNGRLFVADTLNHRVMIWNRIPTQNNQPADLQLGQPNFNSAIQFTPVGGTYPTTAANRLANPVSVTSDGTRLFVSDLGYNRVLIWNSLPTSQDQPADVVVGQPDMTTSVPNWNTQLCGYNTLVTVTLPSGAVVAQRAPCERTLNFPRFALSDGTKLYIADGGNDRVLVFNQIPTTNGAKADAVLGQPDFVTDINSSTTQSIASTTIDNNSSVDTTPSPTSLAYDGRNLYVSDPFNRRVLVFTPSDVVIGRNSAVNWASEIVRQEGVVNIALTSGGTITANDSVTVTVAGTAYSYTVKTNDTLDAIAQGLVSAINANSGDPNATALFSGAGTGSLYLSSKGINLDFDAISLSATASNTANLTVTASGSYLSAGTAATASPGMLIEINGTNLADQSARIDPLTYTGSLPTTLAGVQVYIDGFPAPVIQVSPTQIITQVPFSVNNQPFSNRNSTSIYVRTERSDGTRTASNATPVYIAPANPGLYNQPQPTARPWPAAGAKHQRGNPSAVISIDGSIKAGDTATITVNGANYPPYTVQASDTLGSVVAGLVNIINSDPNSLVTASAGGAFTRVVLTAKASGSAGGDGIPVAGSTSSGAQISVTPYNGTTCCNVTPNSDITSDNPAVAGETIQLIGAGFGVLSDPTANANAIAGFPYLGPDVNTASNSVNATMNGVTAQVVDAGLRRGAYGIYTVQLIVPSNVPNGPAIQTYVAQNAFVSNIVTIPVGAAVQVPPATTPPVVTPTPTCTFSLSATTLNFSVSSNTGALGVTAPSGCSWTATASTPDWITITAGATGSGSGNLSFVLAANTQAAARTGTITVAGQTATVTQAGTATPLPTALRFVPVTPCRVVDTRGANGPILSGGVARDFAIANTTCNIPSTAQAYSLNVTAIPTAQLSYLTVWQSGTTIPGVSTLNSRDGRVKANAAIVPAGNNGAVSVFATDNTQVVLDINGYFVPATDPSALAFFPLAPCRVTDTRGQTSLLAAQARSLPILSSGCGVPANASAYSLNFTAVPRGFLGYLAAWPDGQSQPLVSTLNATSGAITANAAIIPAGVNGNVAVYATDNTDLVVDINGYFAPAATGGLSLYNVTPCRALDTRTQAGQQPIQGTITANIVSSGCGVPTNAGGYVLNTTVLPQGALSYVTLWPSNQQQPGVSTLNAYDGAVTSNLALVPASADSVSVFTTNSTHVILDLFGYFAP